MFETVVGIQGTATMEAAAEIVGTVGIEQTDTRAQQSLHTVGMTRKPPAPRLLLDIQRQL